MTRTLRHLAASGAVVVRSSPPPLAARRTPAATTRQRPEQPRRRRPTRHAAGSTGARVRGAGRVIGGRRTRRGSRGGGHRQLRLRPGRCRGPAAPRSRGPTTTAHRVKANDDSFDSEDMGQGDTFEHTFDAAGTFDYICAIHPSMKGTITVTG